MFTWNRQPRARGTWRRWSALLFVLGVLAGARGAETEVRPEQKELFQLVYQQLQAFKDRNVAGIMATIHPESPLHSATEALLKKTKETYVLHYAVFDLVLEAAGEDEARVAFTQVTERVSGPQFRDNRIKGYHLFKKHEGQWKFFDTKVLATEYQDH